MTSTAEFIQLIQKLPGDAPRLLGLVYLYQQPNSDGLLRQVYAGDRFDEAMAQLRDAGIDPAKVDLRRVQIPFPVRWTSG